MRGFLVIFVMLGGALLAGSAAAGGATADVLGTFTVEASDLEQEVALEYRLGCEPDARSRIAHVVIQGGQFSRMPLRRAIHADTSRVVQPIGRVATLASFTVRATVPDGCRFERFDAVPRAISGVGRAALASLHSPIVAPRRGQYDHPENDVPLKLLHSFHSDPNRSDALGIRYTLVFSDEDSLPNAKKTERQMGRYGRRTDIEWVYQVDLVESTGRVLKRTMQGDLALGIGHVTHAFRGRFLPGTQHPVLYTIARHNVFSDRPKLPYGKRARELSFLDVAAEIEAPLARESIQFREPWIFRASDEELARQGRLKTRSTRYLYLRVRGTLGKKGITPRVRDAAGREYFVADPKARLTRMGEGIWGAEAYTAIELPEELLRDLELGISGAEISFQGSARFEELGALLVRADEQGSYRSVDLSSRLECEAGFSICRVR